MYVLDLIFVIGIGNIFVTIFLKKTWWNQIKQFHFTKKKCNFHFGHKFENIIQEIVFISWVFWTGEFYKEFLLTVYAFIDHKKIQNCWKLLYYDQLIYVFSPLFQVCENDLTYFRWTKKKFNPGKAWYNMFYNQKVDVHDASYVSQKKKLIQFNTWNWVQREISV